MTWQTDDGKHEGWVAPTFADGGIGSGWAGPAPGTGNGGVLVARIGDRELDYDDWQYRPEAEVTGWVMACNCNPDPRRWRGKRVLLGQPWTRVTSPAEQDLAARRVYSPGGDYGDGPREIEDACHAEWRAHVRPDEVLAEVSTLAAEHADVGQRLAEVVGRARAVGVSWTDIGAAAGITRQSAHERWRHVQPAAAEVMEKLQRANEAVAAKLAARHRTDPNESAFSANP